MDNVAGPSSSAGSPHGTTAAPGQLIRIDTGSSVSSSLYSPLTPGFYTLPIHGNCPRCHHRHQAATVRIRISASFSRVSKVNCERCGERWLAFGGGNSTTISLLSQQTTDPDRMELSFRNELIKMVRSATSIASPTALADVPESVSRIQSRVPSVHSPKNSPDIERHQSQSAKSKPMSPSPNETKLVSPSDDEATAADTPDGSARFASHTGKGDKKKSRLATEFTKLRERFPFLKKLRFGRWKSARKPKMSEKKRGKLPVTQSKDFLPEKPALSGSQIMPSSPNIGAAIRSGEEETETGELQDRTIKAASAAHSFYSNDFDMTKEELKKMSRGDRVAWVRKQFSAFNSKCNCPDDCDCRRTGTSAANDGGNPPPQLVPPSPLLNSRHPIGRRRSIDHFFTGIGDHFGNQAAGTLPYPTRPPSLASTSISQAPTLWDGMTVTSAPSNAYLDVVHQHRHRPPSTRPSSLPPGSTTFPRFNRSYMEQDGVDGRSSIDSFTTGGAVASVASIRRQGTDTRSIASPPRTFTAGSHAPTSSLIHVQLPPSDSVNDAASQVSTPRINGYRTSDERDREAT